MKPSKEDYLLYLVTDRKVQRNRSVELQVEQALLGGVRIVQIREKELSTRLILEEVRRVLPLTRKNGAFLLVNDRIDVALAAGADGVHLGQEDMPVEEARRLLGPRALIGVSVSNVDEALEAEAGGGDYLAVNGVFPTSTKGDLTSLPGLEGVAEIRRSTRLPLLGIGGITLENCRLVLEAGADGVAVVSALTTAQDLPATCRRFFTTLKGKT